MSNLKRLKSKRSLLNRSGLSPVIATVLLISITLILAAIIFIWARSVVKEKTEKFGEPIENFCQEVNFEAEADSSSVFIINRGNVGLYGVDVRKRSSGGILSVKKLEGQPISTGESKELSLLGSGIGGGDEIIVVPIIVGESGSNKVAHTCDEVYGVAITV